MVARFSINDVIVAHRLAGGARRVFRLGQIAPVARPKHQVVGVGAEGGFAGKEPQRHRGVHAELQTGAIQRDWLRPAPGWRAGSTRP